MTPPYNRWRERQADSIELYNLGLAPNVIGWWLGVSPTTVWRYLRGVPHLVAARRVAKVSLLPRAPYWELHTRSGADTVTLGRKFCSTCGRWRQLCDFPHNKRGGRDKPLARCASCSRVSRRAYRVAETPQQQAARRERQRFYAEGVRRRRGIPRITYRRRTVIDNVERVYLPREPIATMLDSLTTDTLTDIVRRTGIGDRQLRRIMSGEAQHIRLDLADKLALALGYHLYDLYGETPTITSITALDREVAV
jgi:hypothetical protein